MTLFGPLGSAIGFAVSSPAIGDALFPPRVCTRADVVAMARSQLDVRWLHGAALQDVAMDCYGLITVVGKGIGVKESAQWSVDPATKGYGRQPDGAALTAACRKYLDEIPIALAGLGDLLTFRWEADPQHFGIISNLDPMRIIHSYAAVHKCCETGIDGEWKKGKTWRSLRVSAWRFRGVD